MSDDYATFQQIQRVKNHRYDEAQRLLQKRKFEKIDAEKNAREAKNQLKEYKDFRVKEKNRLYDEVENESVHLKDINELNLKLAQLKTKQLDHEKNSDERDTELKEAEEAVDQALSLLVGAQRDLEKMNIFDEELSKQSKLLEERLYEVEIEDVKTGSMQLAMT